MSIPNDRGPCTACNGTGTQPSTLESLPNTAQACAKCDGRGWRLTPEDEAWLAQWFRHRPFLK